MAWTTPQTWVDDELVTASDLNTHLRDNLNALKAPPTAYAVRDNLGDYSTTATDFELIDNTNLKLTLTTHGGDVFVWLLGTFYHATSGGRVYLDIQVDGSGRLMSTYAGGLASDTLESSERLITLPPILVSGLSAGEHTFSPMWRTNSGTLFLRSDSGASQAYRQVAVHFYAREIS